MSVAEPATPTTEPVSQENTFNNDSTLRSVGRRDGIRVVVRVRPMASFENKPSRDYLAVEVVDDAQTLAIQAADAEAARSFTFHKVLGPGCGQQHFFEQCGIQTLIDSALQGYACTAFAFGQTGSGKTHTITGPSEGNDDGVLQRSIGYLWSQVEQHPEASYSFRASYLEIYNEQVVDLLNVRHDRGAMPVRWKADKGFHVENLYHMDCDSHAAMLGVLEEGLQNRHTASHQMNDRSSRSHTILTIEITSMTSEAESSEEQPGVMQRHGAISFVDLAGSERTNKTKTDGQMLVESNNINKSLLTLGNCISSLADPRKRKGHIPFRDSVLTMLLKDSLGGSGMTLMIACVSPAFSSLPETQNTLRYASRAKRIQNKPIVRMDPQQQMIQALKREVRMLRKECAYLHNEVDSGNDLGSTTLTTEALRAHTLLAGVGRDVTTNNRRGSEFVNEPDLVATMARELTQAKVLLQQYMQENEDLRIENVALSSQYQAFQLDQERVERENRSLMRQLKQARMEYERSRVAGSSYKSRAVTKTSKLRTRKTSGNRGDESYFSGAGSSQAEQLLDASRISQVPGPTQHVTEMAQMAATQTNALIFRRAVNTVMAANHLSNGPSPEPPHATSSVRTVSRAPTPTPQPVHSTPAKKPPKRQRPPKGGKAKTVPKQVKPPATIPPIASRPPPSPGLRNGGRLDLPKPKAPSNTPSKRAVQKEVDSLEAEIAAAEAALRHSTSSNAKRSTAQRVKW
eukprot:m.46969 g.46969  ORF g.46969 m.46969 type:complete len:743 (+) comp13187_c0_seq1:165-2393(+)